MHAAAEQQGHQFKHLLSHPNQPEAACMLMLRCSNPLQQAPADVGSADHRPRAFRTMPCRDCFILPYPRPIGNDGKLPLLSTNADGIHNTDSSEGPKLINCFFGGLGAHHLVHMSCQRQPLQGLCIFAKWWVRSLSMTVSMQPCHRTEALIF